MSDIDLLLIIINECIKVMWILFLVLNFLIIDVFIAQNVFDCLGWFENLQLFYFLRNIVYYNRENYYYEKCNFCLECENWTIPMYFIWSSVLRLNQCENHYLIEQISLQSLFSGPYNNISIIYWFKTN